MTDQELIQALQMCSKVRCPDCLKEHTVCNRRKWMADASTRLETLLAENKQLCWIPVTERLPENEKPFQEYLVTICRDHFPTSSYDVCDDPYSEEYTTTACFDSRNKLWHVCREEVVLNALIMPEDSPVNGECVTAWADMPIPYR